MDQDSSDEDDVFSCGRCKEHFSNIENFMEHKKGRTCKKVKQQQQSQSPPSRNPSSLSGEILDNTSADSQGAYHSRAFTEVSVREATVSAELEYNLQPSDARFLVVLHGGQLAAAGQSDILIHNSSTEVHNGQAMVQVLEKILESQSRDVGLEEPKDFDADDGDDAYAEVQADLNPVNSVRRSQIFTNQPVPEYLPEDQTIVDTHSESLILEDDPDLVQKPEERASIPNAPRDDCSVSKPVNHMQKSGSTTFKSSGQPSRESLLVMDASGSEESGAANKEFETRLQIPEEFSNTQAMTCRFCFETVKNAERLFAHYVAVHKMKSDSAVEFLQQSTIKRKRGRPPKGQSGKKQTTIPCPHCDIAFKTKSLCSAHIKKHHRTEPASLKAEELPSQRRRKCSRCSFQTTTSKDLTAHIHNCHGNKFSETVVEEMRESPKTAQLGEKPRTRRGTKGQRNDEREVGDIINLNNSDAEGEMDNEPHKTHVKCPECKKKLDAGGLKRHQIRCTNRNRFVCPLCQHKSRESYDHTVHLDNHRTWVKAQPSWVTTSKHSDWKPETTCASSTTVDDKMAGLISMDPNVMMSQEDKVDYTSTADLKELVLITQLQNETKLIRQHQEMMPPEDSEVAERDAATAADSSQIEVLDDERGGGSDKADNTSTEQAMKATDGGDKKLKPRDLKCKVCYTWFARTSLPKHMLQAHNMVKRFQCRKLTCKEIFAKVEDFKAHASHHSTENIFICGCRTCVSRQLITPEKMDDIRKEKMRDYYKHMSHKCSKCWVKFPSQGSLDRHLKRESHIHPCNVCGKIQVSNRQLRMHMVIHQEERAFLCEMCGQPFKTKRDLNKHTFSHTNIRPYACSDCPKRFSFKNKLARHILTVHSGTKPFACEWPGCDKAFSRKDKLSDHAKTHVVSVPFKCKYCSKGFSRKDMLKDHEILHTREFRFCCPICNRGFMRHKMLELHCQDEHSSVISHVTIQPSTSLEENADLPSQNIGSVLCEPYVQYANIDHLTSFQENIPETDQLMQGQRAAIEAIQNAAAAVIGDGQNQFREGLWSCLRIESEAPSAKCADLS